MLFSKVSKTDVSLASTQIWDIFYPYINYLPKKDREVIELAFDQMVISHGEQRRKSWVNTVENNEPAKKHDYYITHPVAAAIKLCKLKMDKDTIAACLLHDVPEDTDVNLKDLSKEFSSEIVFLVEGVTKLSTIKYKGENRYAENLRKMFVAMSKDLRVIFIKFADRIHNLETLKFHTDKDKRYRIALESLEIYAPIAERLGISIFRHEIEDLVFPYVYPKEYKKIASSAEIAIQKRTKQVNEIKKKVEQILKQEGIPFEKLFGRAKKHYSIYQKMKKGHKDLDQIHDLVALRVVTFNEDLCYRILSSLHGHFEPIQDRIKDYIANPKSNGYQSIHTTVRDKETGVTFEFQIRTQKMQDYAEFGVAAHWAYKEEQEESQNEFLDQKDMKWINELISLGKEKISEEQYLRRVKLDLFTNRIFVLTPKNDAIDLPVGASALDFAYRIHEEVGETAVMAKVNGHAQKLGYELKNGDQVEIITNKKQKPSRDWLSWVKTSSALKHIRHSLKKMRTENAKNNQSGS